MDYCCGCCRRRCGGGGGGGGSGGGWDDNGRKKQGGKGCSSILVKLLNEDKRILIKHAKVILSRTASAEQNTYLNANCTYPTNIGVVRGTVSVATIVVVSAGVDI